MDVDRAMGRDSTGRAGLGAALALLLAGVLVVGCTVGRPPEGVADADFRLRGKIAVRGPGDAFSASFDWIQTGDAFDIELWGPLGQGRVHLRGDGARLTVTNARGTTTSGIGAEPLMASALGWSVPIAALPYWVRGRYDPRSVVSGEYRGADGTLAGFQQLGWVVEVSRWRESALGPVPARVVATQRERRIVIVCKEWLIA
ncbi:MAG: lipoprotein insertase outer membrane protein LolB [Gammaproteobacteria bacterium]|nr:lipoprotein insertase outer membrane protein LolB [Gammaproteobacteria bacterium]